MGTQLPNGASAVVASADPKLDLTHKALFAFWLPLDEIDLPLNVKGDVAAIAQSVSRGLFSALCASSRLSTLLRSMTDCSLLPFYAEIESSANKAVVDFREHGFGGMKPEYHAKLFSWLFEGPASPALAGEGEPPGRVTEGN